MKTETGSLKKAVYTIRHYNADEEFRMLAEAREEQLRSEKSAMSFWKKEGLKEGVNKEKAATILRMKKSGLTDEQIMLCADCSLDMIKQVCRR